MTEQTILPNAEQLINDNDLVFYTKEMMKIKIQFNERRVATDNKHRKGAFSLNKKNTATEGEEYTFYIFEGATHCIS